MPNRPGVVGWRFACPHPPEGLAGPFGSRPFLGLPLAQRQERAFVESGIRVVTELPDEDVAVVAYREDAALTPQAVRQLADKAAELGEDIRYVPGSRFGNLLADLGLGLDEPLLVWLTPGAPVTLERIEAARVEVFDPEERMIELPMPALDAGVEIVELPLSEYVVLPTWHWVQLLWANLLGLPQFLWRTLAGRNVAEVGWTLLWAAVRARSLTPARVGAQLNHRGKGCNIHPSAVVEGCWLGDDVTIGANAVVRASVLADGCTVEDLAVVEACVLAAGARIQRQAMAKYSILRERSAHGGVVQLGVLDREAAVKRTATLMDQALGQRVEAVVRGARVPAPLGFLGVCVGEGTVVGAGVAVAPGRCLPARLQLFAPPSTVVRRVDPNLQGPATVVDGAVVPR